MSARYLHRLAAACLAFCLSAGLAAQEGGSWLGGGAKSAPPVWNGQAGLPVGLSVVQLKGNMVCPPLRVPGKGILVACDDRTVKLIGDGGDVAWSLDTDRLIRGPLFFLTDSMALVALSGEQVAAFRLDGRLVWQQRIEGSAASWFLGLPDGRLVQAFTDGRIRFCHPDGRTLLSLDLKKGILPVPRLVEGGIEFRLAGGGTRRLLHSGELEPVRPASSSGGQAAQPSPGVGPLAFSSAKTEANAYSVRISGPSAVLDFASKGEIGHWLLDSRDDGLVVWGDSLWRCFIYRPASEARPVKPSAAVWQNYGFTGYFSDLRGSAELEWLYLQSILRENRATGAREVLDHVGQALRAQRLAGKLQFYEDVLATIIDGAADSPAPDTSLMVDSLALMGRFPSLRHLPRVVRLLGDMDDEAVSQACLEFFAALGSDPDGLALAAVERRLDLWQGDGRLARLMKPLKAFTQACQASWPAGPVSTRLKAFSASRG
jgi:hypothetical protein